MEYQNNEIITGQESIEIHRDIETITTEIEFLKLSAGQAILEIGNRLIEAKAQLNQGEWLSWLSDRVQFSVATAERMMRISKEYSDSSLVTNLGSSKALQILALPDFQRDEFIESKHDVGGVEKSVFEMTKRELEEAIKAKTSLEEQVDAYNAHAEELEDQVEALKAKITMLEESPKEVTTIEYVKDEEAERTLKAEIENLKKTVADNQKKADDARAKADDLKKKVDKAAAEKEEALKQAAYKARIDAEEKYKQAAAEMQSRIESLERQVKESGDSAIAVFKIHFDAFQREAEEMKKCIASLSESGGPADKLINAYKAVVEAMGKAF